LRRFGTPDSASQERITFVKAKVRKSLAKTKLHLLVMQEIAEL
jgi:hypothetical protein